MIFFAILSGLRKIAKREKVFGKKLVGKEKWSWRGSSKEIFEAGEINLRCTEGQELILGCFMVVECVMDTDRNTGAIAGCCCWLS
jgi:hypothetical protein